jgi:hypothetical protein
MTELKDSPRLRTPQPVTALAARLGWSEGDVWTLAIGLSLASLLAVSTIPAALTERSAVSTGAAGTADSSSAPPAADPAVPAEPTPDLSVPAPDGVPPVAAAPPLTPLTPLLEGPSEQGGGGGFGSGGDGSGPPLPSGGGDQGPAFGGSGQVFAPLQISVSGYTAAPDGGLPVGGGNDVPADGLPVGSDATGDTFRSFIRLTGTEPLLVLDLLEGASENEQFAGVRACPIQVAGWTLERGAPLGDGPEFDCADAVPGERQEDGSFRFDLLAFPDRGGDRGFALVPAQQLPVRVPFRLVFSTTARAAMPGPPSGESSRLVGDQKPTPATGSPAATSPRRPGSDAIRP